MSLVQDAKVREEKQVESIREGLSQAIIQLVATLDSRDKEATTGPEEVEVAHRIQEDTGNLMENL